MPTSVSIENLLAQALDIYAFTLSTDAGKTASIPNIAVDRANQAFAFYRTCIGGTDLVAQPHAGPRPPWWLAGYNFVNGHDGGTPDPGALVPEGGGDRRQRPGVHRDAAGAVAGPPGKPGLPRAAAPDHLLDLREVGRPARGIGEERPEDQALAKWFRDPKEADAALASYQYQGQPLPLKVGAGVALHFIAQILQV